MTAYSTVKYRSTMYRFTTRFTRKLDSLFLIRFANTILSQLPRTCFAVLFNCESSSSTIYDVCLSVCLSVTKVEIHLQRVSSKSEQSLGLTDQSEDSIRSAVQFRPSKCNVLSLSTPFHFRYHNLIK